MLKLKRKPQESIKIFVEEHEITIFVEKIKGNQVKLSIDADDDVDIFRTELMELPEN